ncbi:MAG: hypothetical protein A3D10_03730 [Omnitrophica WOR_2 bacterium RIFCSPHIGHO2_02_FULL_48_11]|nr:MAG: hypothetical protein A3D10_03730 [Omnitrophica WOR_2 bacterium RIFCSPHIGHO2_02_FULL_48_11]
MFIILGFLAYGNAIRHPFVHDDVVFIVYNPHIADLRNLWSVFVEPFWLAPASSLINLYHRPLLEVVYRLEYAAFGFDAHGYHFLNILIHIGNAFLLFRILSRIFQKGYMPVLGAVFFLVHPIQTEAVACISGISNLLSGFFVLTSFYLYVSARHSKTAVFLAYVCSVLFFILALLAKEQMIVFPVFLIFYEWCFPHPAKERAGGKRYAAATTFVLVSTAYVFLRGSLAGGALSNLFVNPLELWLRILSIPQTILMYGQLLLLPLGLHYYRSVDVLASSWLTPIVFLCVALVIAGVVVRAASDDKQKIIFGLGWFGIFLLPTLNIVPLIIEYSHISTAEHFLYLPMAGFFIFIFAALERPFKSFLKEKEQQRIFLAVLVIVLMAATARQNTYWRGEVPLFERTTQYEKKMARVYLLLANAYYFNGQMDQAIASYQQALHIIDGYLQKPLIPSVRDYYLGLDKGIHLDMARGYEQKNDFSAAIRQYETALKLDPQDSAIYNDLGKNYRSLGDETAAVWHFQKSSELLMQEKSGRKR